VPENVAHSAELMGLRGSWNAVKIRGF
jgi:hypothetical protein